MSIYSVEHINCVRGRYRAAHSMAAQEEPLNTICMSNRVDQNFIYVQEKQFTLTIFVMFAYRAML